MTGPAWRETEIRWLGNRMWHVQVGTTVMILHSEELGKLCEAGLAALMHLPGTAPTPPR